jgi:uncharacterized protein (UPF0276 family)
MARLESRGVSGPIPACAGIGFRSVHHHALVTERPAVGWIEAHTENYFHEGGAAGRALDRARANYPLSLHGVGLGLGSAEGVDREHLARVKRAIARFEPALVSEHACWGSAGGEFFNDLLPLPYTDEAVELLARQVGEAQDFLGVQLLIENVSAYVSFEHSRLKEWEFLSAVAAISGCGLLLDVNNVYVNAHNHGFDPLGYLRQLPLERVVQLHIAGHSQAQGYLADTHSAPVAVGVWELLAEAVRLGANAPLLLEWDAEIPAFPELERELDKARALWPAEQAELAS